MDGLALVMALVALVVAFNARKAAKTLELALARTAARLRQLEVDLERPTGAPTPGAPEGERPPMPGRVDEPAPPEPPLGPAAAPEPAPASPAPSVPQVAATMPTARATL